MKHMENAIIKSRQGFTLVEVIISIAVLSLICAIVLRLFVLSNDVSKQARISDLATVYAMNAVELCKSTQSPADVFGDVFFEGSEFEISDKLQASQYFTADWVRIPEISADALTTNAIYQLTVTLSPNGELNKNSVGIGLAAEDEFVSNQLYDISVRVQKIKDYSVDINPIILFETSHYYVYKEPSL